MSGAAQNEGTTPQVHSDDVQSSTKSAHTTTSADNATAAATEEGSSETQQETQGRSERQTGSPEPNCAICLGQLENKSFTDSCFHMFCFVCLQEWSKVKAECPLCKQPFKSIIHNVKSYNNYDQFYLDHHPRPSQPLHFGWNFDRSFRYRTTLTMDHRYFHVRGYPLMNDRDLASRESSTPMFHRPVLPRYRLRSRTVQSLLRPHTEPVSTTAFRRHIYETGRRVSASMTNLRRRRRVSPDFFRSNPAQIHRLVPWLNRELNALLYNVEEQVTFVLELILGLIKRFHIDSDEFFEHIHPYVLHNTRHFMHEFLNFARSPYTMHTYDSKAVYEEPSQTIFSSESSASDSDVVVVDDDDDEPGIAPSGSHRHRSARAYSPWHSPQALGISPSASSTLAMSRWDSPTPGPSWDLSGNSSHSPVNVDDSSDSDASTIIDPTYTAPEEPSSQAATTLSQDTSDEEAVIFLSYDKPWEERSPIQLSSGSESETSIFVKALKQENNKRKKARFSSGLSETKHQSTGVAQDGAGSLTPPIQHQFRSHHSSSSSHDLHHSSTGASSRNHQEDRYHRKRRHHEKSEESHHSSRSVHREKRRRTHSHSSVPAKKHRHDKMGKDGDSSDHLASHKKHKHKKHKKNKERKDKHSKRRPDSHRPAASQGASESAASPTSAERADHCKKHPSGHKKSRVKSGVEGLAAEPKEGSSGHHSDSLLSDTSTSSGNSTGTTTSLTDTESTARYFSRQQRLQQVLQERQRQACLPMARTIMERAPSWENISRLASMLASHTSSQLPAIPGPSQSSNDPVIIYTSSDDSESDVCGRKGGAGHVTTDTMPVAKTVVVPCSANPEVPTAAIDTSSTPASSSVQKPVMIDNYIDVESISSEEEMSEAEVVDVESVDDTDSSSELINIHNSQEKKAGSVSAGTRILREDSATAQKAQSVSSVHALQHDIAPHCSSKGGETRPVSADMGSVSEVSAEHELIDSPYTTSVSQGSAEPDSASHETISARLKSVMGTSSKPGSERVLSPRSVAILKHRKPSESPKGSLSTKKSFMMQFILNEDVFMGSGCSSQPLSTSNSAAMSALDLPESAGDLVQSQPSSLEVVSTDDPLNQDPFTFASALRRRLYSGQRETNMQAPLPSSSTVSQCNAESPSTTVVSQHSPQNLSVPAVSQHSSESLSLSTTVSQHSVTNRSLPLPVSEHSAEGQSDCPASTPQSSLRQEEVNCAKNKEWKTTDEEVESGVKKNSGSNCSSKDNDLNGLTLSRGENDIQSMTDSQLFQQEPSSLEENRVTDTFSDSIHVVDFPVKKLPEESDMTDDWNSEKELSEDKKSGDEDIDVLNDPFLMDVDEDAEKLLLSEDVNVCVPSDQEKTVQDLSNSVDSGQVDCETPADTQTAHSDSLSSKSQSSMNFTTLTESCSENGVNLSSSPPSPESSSTAEPNTDAGTEFDRESSAEDVHRSTGSLPDINSGGEDLDSGVPSAKTTVSVRMGDMAVRDHNLVFQQEQTGFEPDEKSLDI